MSRCVQTAVNATTAELLKKQEELERKAQELERRERELQAHGLGPGACKRRDGVGVGCEFESQKKCLDIQE